MMPNIFHSRAKPAQDGAQHLFIAMLVGSPVEAGMIEFMWQTGRDLQEKGIAADLFLMANHCHVDDARNLCVHTFLETACTDLIFIDSDTAATADAVARLASFDRDVIAGIYPFKDDIEGYPVRLLPKGLVMEDDGSAEVEMVPTGFLRIRRNVLEDLAKACKGHFTKEITRDSGRARVPLIFERTLADDGDRWGGDYEFCRKWASQGGKIYIDPSLYFRHYGMKPYAGNYGTFWAKANGTFTPAFIEAISRLYHNAPLPHTFGRLAADWGNSWAANPAFLKAAYLIVREAKGPVLEAGSGLSTLILGIAAQHAGVRVHALENDPGHYKRTIAALKAFGITSVRLHYAPIRRHVVGDKQCLWYEIPADLPASFDVVVADGPAREYGREGLYHILADRITGATWIADDADSEAADFIHCAGLAGRAYRMLTDNDLGSFIVSPRPETENTVSTAA